MLLTNMKKMSCCKKCESNSRLYRQAIWWGQ